MRTINFLVIVEMYTENHWNNAGPRGLPVIFFDCYVWWHIWILSIIHSTEWKEEEEEEEEEEDEEFLTSTGHACSHWPDVMFIG